MPGASLSGAVRSMMRDARNHNSPNAGWQEAALAGALGLALAGPRNYGGIPTQGAWMGDGRSEVSPTDITRGCVLYKITCGIILIILLAGLLI
jgi:adenosylcobinamide-phosphate synthase